MKRNILYIFIFVVSSFFFTLNVKADYIAYANNGSSGAKCSLDSKSTGYCFYKDSNLNSLETHVRWLDNGDKVTVSTSINPIKSKDSVCSGNYVYASYYHSGYNATYSGYYCDTYLEKAEITDELKTKFESEGFPKSYWDSLAVLSKAHPNWNFKGIKTNLNFNDAVEGEATGARSLIQGGASNNYAYLALDYGAFDYMNNKYIAYDNKSATKWTSRWYRANKNTIAYYMDPRNFLNDMYIFQYESLVYEKTISDENIIKSITKIFENDYLSKFTNDFLTAGKESGVNPVYLASLSKQEVGVGKTANSAVDGKYNGMYNFYNIGATGGETPVINGLKFAANTDIETLRPWDTTSKAITGGAIWINSSYIGVGQNTSYFKRFNVIYNYLKSKEDINYIPYSNYTHQYQTNTMAPSSEANITYKSYFANNLLDSEFTFYIPIYKNMPTSTSLPTKEGWPNNYLNSLKINGQDVADFSGEINTYNYYLSTTTLKLEAKAKDSSAKISGLGTFTITKDCTKTIKVTAENGDAKEYYIKIILSEDAEKSIDVVSTLNKAGIKNGTYIYGLNVGTDISTITTKIKNANKSAEVKTTTYNGTSKATGTIVTGDKITITSGEETKTYEIVIYGDVNGDGKIKATDYVKIKNHIMGEITLSGSYKEAADVDRNGKVKATDYVKIKNHIMGNVKITQ